MEYQEWRNKNQKEFNSLPIFFAFSKSQFKEEMEKRGLSENDTDKIYSLGQGGFYLKKDAEVIRDYFNRNTEDELKKMIENDSNFAKSAFMYEMKNHEYQINWQGDYDVCSCFGDGEYSENKTYNEYLKEMGYSENVINIFREVKREYWNYCIEHDLF